MDHPIHLVFVNGLANPRQHVDGSVNLFFSRLFPRALIDEFSVLQPTQADWHLRRRAQALLEQVLKAFDPDQPTPIVFLSHGLGGLVVKEAIMLAVESPSFAHIAMHTCALFFFCTPHRASADLSWEHLCLRLVSALPSLPRNSVELLGRFVEQVKSSTAMSSGIPLNVDLINYYEDGSESVIHQSCAALPKGLGVNCPFECSYQSFSGFGCSQQDIAASVVERLLATRHVKYLESRKLFLELSTTSPKAFQLLPSHRFPSDSDDGSPYNECESWKNSSDVNILHINGALQSRTPLLVRQILSDIIPKQLSQNMVILSFKFDRKNTRARSLFDLYHSLCRQILVSRPQTLYHVFPYAGRRGEYSEFEDESISVLFHSMLNSLIDHEISIFCLICDLNQCLDPIAEAIGRLKAVASTKEGQFKLLLTAEETTELTGDSGQQIQHVAIQPGSHRISNIIRLDSLSTLSLLKQENSAWCGLENSLIDYMKFLPQNDPFLVAELNMILLRCTTQGCTRKELEKKLQGNPKDLTECYKQLLLSISEPHRSSTLTLLKWMSAAVRPLSQHELAVTVAVNSPSWNGADTEKMIFLDVFEILQDCMAPLIRFQDTYAYFIHDSFRQYLVEHGTQYSATVSSYSPEAGEEAMEQDDDCWIIRHCFNYLRRVGQHVMGVVESGDRQRISLLQDEHGLLRYTTLNWPQHFRQSRCRETTKTQILGFFQNKEQLDTWAACFKCVQTSVTGKACEVTDIDTLLKIVCYYGLDEILESCIESSKDDGNFDSQKSYCLDLAAKRGHHGIVQALLDEGAYSDKAFGLAVTGEHHDVCELLLESNPDSINQPGLHRQVPLYWATHIGSNSMVSFLLARHANPNFPFAARHGPDMETLDIPSNPSYHQDRADNETPIHLAALTGQKEILQILLGGGADVYQRSPVGYDALLYAAWGGSHEIVSFLLSQGADGGAKSEPTQNTALHLAAEHGHYRIVEILILHLKDRPELLSIPDKMGLAPIHLAAREGHLKVLVLLLDALESNGNTTKASETQDRDESLTSSFDEDYFERWRLARRRMRHRWRRIAQSSYGSSGAKTAVEWAAENGQNEVLLTLLAKKTTVPGVHVTEARRDEDGYTVLHLAAKKGFPYVVKRLQEDTKYAALLPVNDKSERDGMTPLHLAAREGHADVVTILLQHGGNPDVTNEWEQTALHIAAKHGHLLCLDELLQKSDVLSVDMFHRTALHLAAGNGHFGVVAKLHKDSDIWAESKDGYTVLDLVTEKCSFDQVKSFVKILEDGSDGDVFTTKGLPLHAAARRNDIEILQFLQQKGWDHEATSSLGRSPLHDAVSYKSLDAVDMLLAQFKCNVDAVDDSREAPIHCAKDTNILKRLLESEAKYDEKNGLGQTPLFLAAYGQLPDIVDILLGLNPEPDVNVPDSDGWSPLHAAYDSPRITRSLIKHHAKTDVLTSEGRTPLAMAVRWDVMETVEILLDAGASPDHAGSSDQRPLALAYTSVQSESRLHITKLLIDHGADPRLRFEADVTILDVAAKEGDQAAVKYILKKLVERPLPDDELREMCTSAIKRHVASRYNFNRELAEMLNTQGYFAVTKCHPDALTAACENGSIEAVEWLLEQIEALQENKGCYGRALHAAVKSDYEAEEKVSRLLEHSDHIDINDGGYDQPTALQQAAYHGDGALLNLLLEKGADACLAKGDLDTVLNCAIANPEIDGSIIKTILTNAGNAQTAGLKGRYPIHQAAIHDRADVIEILGTGGLDAYVMDEEGLSPLMYGLIGKNNSVVNRLLSTECGFRLEDADSNGLTPLMTATILSDASSVQSLLEKGFGNDAQDYQGNTALSFACDNDRPELVSILLAHKADPTVVDCRGNGPLYWATRMAGRGMMEDIMSNMDFLDDSSIQHLNVAIHGAVASNKREALELLLSSNANVDPNYARCDGWTPLYTAFRYGFDHIQSLLEDVLGTSYMSGTVALEMPTRWHPEDKHPGIAIDDDNTSALKSVGTKGLLNLKHHFSGHYGIVRADHPMVPLIENRVYYFEVTITACGVGSVGVGFCEDHTPQDIMLGWESGTWGFHSDDGMLFGDGKRGREYHSPYEDDVTIGCGVDFSQDMAFYTRDGKIIGRAFDDVRGKLYPAVSIELEGEWRMTTVFPGVNGEFPKGFLYKGNFPAEYMPEVEEQSGSSGSSDVSS